MNVIKRIEDLGDVICVTYVNGKYTVPYKDALEVISERISFNGARLTPGEVYSQKFLLPTAISKIDAARNTERHRMPYGTEDTARVDAFLFIVEHKVKGYDNLTSLADAYL